MSDTKTTYSGPHFFSLMFLIFLTLKLCGVIDWSWWWVTAPLWGGALLWIGIIALMLAAALFCHYMATRR